MPGSLFRRSAWWVALSALALLGAGGAGVLFAMGFVPLREPDPARFPIRGIDVSHHQGPVDWAAVRETPVHFAFIKATEGGDHHDPRFVENWRSAEEAGIPRGAYHFFTFCSPGAAQAEHFLAVVPPGEGELPPVVDVEFTGNCTSWESLDKVRDELSRFLDDVRDAHGREPLIYLNRPSFRRIVRGHFPDSPLWVRDLLFRPRAAHYGDWSFWQYDDDGRVAGIEGPVDLNVFAGSAQGFADLTQ